MILGLGTDMIDIQRVQKTLDRFGDRFVNRVFDEKEKQKAARRPARYAATLAKRFAAKEACAKALGTGLRQGVFWKDMVVENLPTGQPTMKLTGGAKKRLDQITPDGMQSHIHLSLSDDDPWAQATIIISARSIKE